MNFDLLPLHPHSAYEDLYLEQYDDDSLQKQNEKDWIMSLQELVNDKSLSTNSNTEDGSRFWFLATFDLKSSWNHPFEVTFDILHGI